MPDFFYLGIDGGATKTDYALADRTGQILKQLKLPPCNPFDCGIDEASARLQAGIAEVCSGIAYDRISAFAGLSGGVTAGMQQKFAAFFAGFGFARVQNGSDMQNAVAAALGTGDGICAILGTGSVVCAVKDGKLHRFGGYGYFFDDTLSGFDLGRCAVAAALQDAEGTGPHTLLTDKLTALCGGPVQENLSAFYAQGKTHIASFAPAVFDAAREEDPVATRIVKDRSQKLCETLLCADRLFSDVFTKKIVLIGGLCAHEDILRPCIEPFFPMDTVVFSKTRQVLGALTLAGAPERISHA